jgi:hypothetical protein
MAAGRQRKQPPKLRHCRRLPPHSHSIVLIECNELIFLRKNFLRTENFRRPNRRMYAAFDFKEEVDRSGNSSLSGTIDIDRAIS